MTRTESTSRPDAALNLPLYTYFTIPKNMKGLIPSWLWEKKMVNSNTRGKQKNAPSPKLFEGDGVDVYTLADDLTKLGYFPCYIHHQTRDNGTIRVRVDWEKDKIAIPVEQVKWVLMLLDRFVWDAVSYRNEEGTEFLPPHINLSLGNPQERNEATSVHSVQVYQRGMFLFNDPDATQEETNRQHRSKKAAAR